MQNIDSLLWEYGHLMQELQTCNDYFVKRKIESRMNVEDYPIDPKELGIALDVLIKNEETCESKQKKNKF